MTEVPQIDELPPVPDRASPPSNFDEVADTFFDGLTVMRTQQNAQAVGMNASRSETEEFKTLAENYAQRAEDSTIPDVGGYSALHYAAKTAADRVQTGLDRTQTGVDATTSQAAAAAAQAGAGLPALTGNAGKALVVNGAENGVEYETISGDTQTFTSSGTWTKPPNITYVRVECIGGGQGGSSGRTGAASSGGRTGGAGGAGGAGRAKTFLASELDATVAVTIGAGGAGGAAVTTTSTVQNIGASGGDTSFGALLKAYGADNTGASGITAAQVTTQTGVTIAQSAAIPVERNGGGGGDGGNVGSDGGDGTDAIEAGAGGGGGGDVPASNVATAGGKGGWQSVDMTGPDGGAAGANGIDGSEIGEAGSGGGGNNAGNGGTGGDGGIGAGGGGGGGATNGNNSGAGGRGGDGWCRVMSW